MKRKLIFYPPIVAFDVDNTLLETNFPHIIKAKPYCFWLLKEIKEAGWRQILFTNREGEYLQQAKDWFKDHGFEFDAYNDNSAIRKEEWENLGYKDTRKIGCDVIVDDKSIFWKDDLREVGKRLLEIYDKRV
ncbi:MAG: hypothetical protein ACOCRK_10500 [bacterium]